jgi:hypothetical protein
MQHDHHIRPALYLEVIAPALDLAALKQQLHAALGEQLALRSPSNSPELPQLPDLEESAMMRLLLLTPDGSVSEQLAASPGERLPDSPGSRVFRLSAARGRLFLVQHAGADEEIFALEYLPLERAEILEEQAPLLPGLRRVVLLLDEHGVPGACHIDGAVAPDERGP